MKQYFYRLSIVVLSLVIVGRDKVFAQTTEDEFYYKGIDTSAPTTTSRDIIKSELVDANDGILKRILRAFNMERFINLSNASALEYVKFMLNVLLSLTALVAFVIIIYGFAKIIFSEDEEGITNARKTVQWAAIAIAIIGASWFIVSFLFNIYESVRNI